MRIIGRERERRTLMRCESSEKPEFIAVYGRRRVGKAKRYLIDCMWISSFMDHKKTDR